MLIATVRDVQNGHPRKPTIIDNT
ncbi:hypothetical protein P041_02680, partial [Brucella sp. 04-5288]